MIALYIVAALLLGIGLGYALGHFRAAARLTQARSEATILQTRLESLQSARQELLSQFQVLAAQILEDHSRRFTAQNREAIGALLAPLGDRIADFRKKVEDVHLADVQQRSALKQQVELLADQSRDIGQKADHLAEALKGDNKMLGHWGELALERLLESAGLQADRDYKLQFSVPDGDGGRAQPDVVVLLPENRWILLDAKMSLKDYMDYVNADTDVDRSAALKSHVASIETHVKGLSARRYPDLDAFKDRTPDFVLMFVPNEPALALALSARPALHQTAARANVILVGPGGLLATLRLVGQIWRQDNQRRAIDNVFDAVRKIYEKYVGFAEDMEQINLALQKTQAAYDAALKKLATGDGNLIRQMDTFVNDNIIKPKRLPPSAFRPEPPPAPEP